MMPFPLIGRRHWLRSALALAGTAVVATETIADPAAVAAIRELCDALLNIMKAGQNTPFGQRYAMIAPVIDRVFDLRAILQTSVGLSWPSVPPQQQTALLSAFQRYTIANYVSNFDNFTGQRFVVQPDTESLPNNEELAKTRIIPASGDSHELDYVMRRVGAQWKVIDVLADGSISRVAVQRSDFRGLLARGGAPALIESLNQKTNTLSGGALT